MSTAFADAQARLGESVIRRQANAQALLPLGTSLVGIFTRRAAEGTGMRARDVSFRCLTAELAEDVAPDTVITITHSSGVTAWSVLEAIVHHELGQTELVLVAEDVAP